MPSVQAIQAFLQAATARGSKSTAMQPLAWLIGILVSGLICGAVWDAPNWLLVTLLVFLGCAVMVYLVGFSLFGFYNPDALRSERFHLSKLAIEKNLIGDNIAGMKEIDEGAIQGSLELPPANLEDRR